MNRILSDSRSAAAFFTVFILSAVALHRTQLPEYRLSTDRLSHLHYHMAVMRLDAPKDAFEIPPEAAVYFGEEKIIGIGDEEKVEFSFDDSKNQWTGIFPVPWSAANGFYTIRLDGGTEETFLIRSRSPYELKDGPLKVMNLESTRRLSRFRYITPEGEQAGYEAMFDWIKFLGGNALWYIAGQTASYTEGDIDRDFPWLKPNMETLDEFAAAAREREIGFGAWVVCYRTFGIRSLKPDQYKYSMNFRNSRIVESEGISISDPRRLAHIKDLVSRLNKMDNVDFIGLDYIRPAGGGLELVDQFTAAMRIDLPEGWEELSQEERMAWLGAIATRRSGRERRITEKWNWWRAHRMAHIINDIKESTEITKPLWTFVLSWELGRQHGQDPVMFSDAGVDVIAIMMYETDTARFNHLIREWKKYTEDFRLNLVPGNQIDWAIHQNTVYPSGPEEFYRRIESSVEHLGENAKGVFVNDISRAFTGRRGPYCENEWLMASGKAFSLAREAPGLEVAFDVPDRKHSSRKTNGFLNIRNLTDEKLQNIRIEFPAIPGVEIFSDEDIISEIGAGSLARVGFTVRVAAGPSRRMGRYMLAARVVQEDDVYINYRYLWVDGQPPDPGWVFR